MKDRLGPTGLSLSASVNYQDRTLDVDRSKVFNEYSISWSPLRDGSLSLTVVYSGADEGRDEEARTFSQQLQWKIAPGMVLSLGHTQSERRTDFQIVDTHTYRGNFRFFL